MTMIVKVKCVMLTGQPGAVLGRRIGVGSLVGRSSPFGHRSDGRRIDDHRLNESVKLGDA
jgi:hypothetical protein